MTYRLSFAAKAVTRAGSDSETLFANPQAIPCEPADTTMIHSIHVKLSLLILGALLQPVPATASVQSLGEIARQYRKEREARKKKGELPVRVFTNDDITTMPPLTILESSPQEPPEPPTKQPVPSRPHGTTGGERPAAQTGKAEGSAKSKEYWQARFKAARAALARAEEAQTLVEDELRLLQIQQARELDPDRSRKLNGQIDASSTELKSKRSATEKAQTALDKIEKDFKESGAPQAWIQDDTKPD
jgi:hypothetical protein